MAADPVADGPPVENRHRSGDRRAVASDVATLTSELSDLARRSNLAVLAYFLDMARVEAQSIADEGRAEKGQL
jgi:hypothetical protein